MASSGYVERTNSHAVIHVQNIIFNTFTCVEHTMSIEETNLNFASREQGEKIGSHFIDMLLDGVPIKSSPTPNAKPTAVPLFAFRRMQEPLLLCPSYFSLLSLCLVEFYAMNKLDRVTLRM